MHSASNQHWSLFISVTASSGTAATLGR